MTMQQDRTPDQEASLTALLGTADVLYGLPAGDLLRATLEANPRLRWVQTMAAGGGSQVTAAGLSPEEHARVTFTTSAGVHGIPLAEFAILAIFAGAKDLPRLQRQQRDHQWPERVVTRPIEGSTVLVIGLGGIGTEVARRCQALGMHVMGTRRRPEPVAHVDEGALTDALRSGQVGFAALDVFAVEPLPADSPLWDLDTVLVSPHSAALDAREEERIADLLIDNLRRFLEGAAMRNVVDPAYGY